MLHENQVAQMSLNNHPPAQLQEKITAGSEAVLLQALFCAPTPKEPSLVECLKALSCALQGLVGLSSQVLARSASGLCLSAQVYCLRRGTQREWGTQGQAVRALCTASPAVQ